MRWRDSYTQIFDTLAQITDNLSSESLPELFSQLLFGTQELKLLGPVFSPVTRTEGDVEQIKKKTIIHNGTKRVINAHTAEQTKLLYNIVDVSVHDALRIVEVAESISHLFENWSVLRTAVHIYHAEYTSAMNIALLLLSNYSLPSAPEWLISSTNAFFSQILEDASEPGHVSRAIERCSRLFNQAQFYGSSTSNGASDSEGMDQTRILHAESCKSEACLLSLVLFLISFNFGLNTAELMAMLSHLRNCEEYGDIYIVMASSAMAALYHIGVLNPTQGGSILPRLELSLEGVTNIHNAIMRTPWKREDMRGAVMTQWQCYLSAFLYMEDLNNNIDPRLKTHISGMLSEAARIWKSHVINCPETFDFLTNYMLQFRRARSELPQDVRLISEVIPLHIDRHLLLICEGLIDGMVVLLKQELKEIKSHSENHIFSYGDCEPFYEGTPECTITTPWQTLTKFIITIFRDRPDRALSFWRSNESDAHSRQSWQIRALYSNGKQAFIKMLADLSTSTFINMFMQVLAPLSTGAECAKEVSMRLMSDSQNSWLGNVSWNVLFPALTNLVDALSGGYYESVIPSEENLVKSFLKIISQIAKYYPIYKWTLHDNSNHKILRVIFSLLLSSNSVYMKAAALNVIASICIPMDQDYDMQYYVWLLMEESKLVPVTMSRYLTNNSAITQGSASSGLYLRDSHVKIMEGISYDLEEVESHNQTYPETIAFLNLINVLLHGDKYSSALNAIRSIGSGNRLPGLRPYIQFIRDSIYINVHIRNFLNDNQRWEIVYHCMEIFDRSLSLYSDESGKLNAFAQDVDDLQLQYAKGTPRRPDSSAQPDLTTRARALALEPGFEVLVHILSNSMFLQRLFSMLKGASERDDGDKELPPYFFRAVHAILRMFIRTFQIQEWFLKCYIPILSKYSLIDHLMIPRTISFLEKHFAINQDAVLSLSLLVGSDHYEIAYLALKILTLLSKTSTFMEVDTYNNCDRLARIVVDSEKESKVFNSFIKRLSEEERESYQYIGYGPGDSFLDTILNKRASETLRIMRSEVKEIAIHEKCDRGVIHLIRATILDFFLSSTKNRDTWTLAHHVLGYEFSEYSLGYNHESLTAPLSRHNCLSVIVSRLQSGLSDRDIPGLENSERCDALVSWMRMPFILTHPCLSVRYYELLYVLCDSALTAVPTIRYLRSSGNFFYSQIKNLISIHADVDNELLFENGSPYIAIVYSKSWIMQLAALEIYRESSPLKGSSKAEDIVSFLFKPAPKSKSAEEFYRIFPHNTIRRTNIGPEFERPFVSIIEILHSLSFSSAQLELDTPCLKNTIFSTINISDYTADIFGMSRLHEAMNAMIKKQSQQSHFYLTQKNDILKRILRVNISREMLSARSSCALSWGQLLDIILYKGLDCISAEVRKDSLLQCLSVILEKVSSQKTLPSISESIALVILSLVDRIGAEVQFGSFLSGAQDTPESDSDDMKITSRDGGSTWRLIMCNMFNYICAPNISQDMRNVLYCALLRIIQCAQQSMFPAYTHVNRDARDLLLSMVALGPSMGRLITTICRDSMTVYKHWKVILYALLDGIIWLLSIRGRGEIGGSNPAVETLSKSGYISLLVQSIYKEDNINLNELFKNIDEDSFYDKLSYDMKMCILLRLSQSNHSCKILIKCGLIETLTGCTFMSREPENLAKGKDHGVGNTEKLHYYNDTFISVMLLINSICATTTSDLNVLRKVLMFALSKKELFNSILKFSSVTSPLPDIEKLEVTLCMYAYLAENGLFFDEEALSQNLEISRTLIHHLAGRFFELEQLSEGPNEYSTYDGSLSEQRYNLITLINTHLTRFWRAILSPPKSYSDTVDNAVRCALFPGFFLDSTSKESLSYPTMKITCSKLSSLLKEFQNMQALCKKLLDRKDQIWTMSIAEVDSIIEHDSEYLATLTDMQKRQLSVWKISDIMEARETQLSYMLLTMEMLTFIMWKYLKLYEKLSDPYENSFSFVPDLLPQQGHRSQTRAALSPILHKILANPPGDSTSPGSPKVPILHILASKILEILNRDEAED